MSLLEKEIDVGIKTEYAEYLSHLHTLLKIPMGETELAEGGGRSDEIIKSTAKCNRVVTHLLPTGPEMASRHARRRLWLSETAQHFGFPGRTAYQRHIPGVC